MHGHRRACAHSWRRHAPFQGAAAGVGEGTRDSGSQGYALRIWGVSGDEYIRVADTWPLNPKGEIMLGLKVEDRFAVANVARSVAVPGIAFAEWGPGDMSWSLKLTVDHSKPYPPSMIEMRAKVFAAVKANRKFFLDGVRLPTIGESEGRDQDRLGRRSRGERRAAAHQARNALVRADSPEPLRSFLVAH